MVADMFQSDGTPIVFEYVFSTGSRRMLWAVLAGYLISAITVPVSVFAASKLFAEASNATELAIASVFVMLAIFCVVVTSKLTWDWIHPTQWGIAFRKNTLLWYTPRERVSVATDEIAKILIHNDWEYPRMLVTSNSGAQWNVHSNCLGELDELCRQVCLLAPDISLSYSGHNKKSLERELGRSLAARPD